jgi:hypothetical protein
MVVELDRVERETKGGLDTRSVEKLRQKNMRDAGRETTYRNAWVYDNPRTPELAIFALTNAALSR